MRSTATTPGRGPPADAGRDKAAGFGPEEQGFAHEHEEQSDEIVSETAPSPAYLSLVLDWSC